MVPRGTVGMPIGEMLLRCGILRKVSIAKVARASRSVRHVFATLCDLTDRERRKATFGQVGPKSARPIRAGQTAYLARIVGERRRARSGPVPPLSAAEARRWAL